MPIRTVIFDFDGVIADTEPLHLAIRREICAELTGGKVFPAHAAIIGGSTCDEYARMIEMYGLSGSPEVYAREHFLRTAALALKTFPHPPEALLVTLLGLEARGIPFAVCSSSPRNYLDAILCGWRIERRFAFLTSADDAPRVKPAPDLYLHAITQSGLPVEELLAVEDSKNGLCATAAAGLRCLGFLPVPTGQDLSAAAAVVKHLPDILGWIDRDNGA